jgi:hypothetical protein
MAHSMSHAVAFVADDPFGSTLVLLGPRDGVNVPGTHVTSEAVRAFAPPEAIFDYDIIDSAFSIGLIDLGSIVKAQLPAAPCGAEYSTVLAIKSLFVFA